MPKRVKPRKTYRVWLEQVNASIVDVRASSHDEIEEKALRKWARECGRPRVTNITQIPDDQYNRRPEY